MSKKEPKAKEAETTSRVIPPAKYWEWRTSIEEFLHQKTKALLSEEQHKTLRAQEEVAKLKCQLHTLVVSKNRTKIEEAEATYQKFLESLEKDLGFSIKGKMIDPYTYEVKDE